METHSSQTLSRVKSQPSLQKKLSCIPSDPDTEVSLTVGLKTVVHESFLIEWIKSRIWSRLGLGWAGERQSRGC